MNNLIIYRARPNPAGKDKNRFNQASETQLGGEWIDIRNRASGGIDLAGINLYHRAYKKGGADYDYELVIALPDWSLPAGDVLRVHSGSGPKEALRQEDRDGARWHMFTHKNYVWNNDYPDEPTLYRSSDKFRDDAIYDANPPEGVELVRVGDRLVPASVRTYSGN